MKTWDLKAIDLKPRLPEILSSSDEARVIALDLATGEDLAEHEVHERAWVIVISGAIEIGTRSGGRAEGGPGMLVEFEPGERHHVIARDDARLLLILSPWPGEGHPGAMTIREKLYARQRAAKLAGRTSAGATATGPPSSVVARDGEGDQDRDVDRVDNE